MGKSKHQADYAPETKDAELEHLPAEDGVEEEEEEEEQVEDPEVDFEAIAESAVDYALKAAKRQDQGQLKLDIGLGEEHLYLRGDNAFNTAVVPGHFDESTSSLCSSGPAVPGRELHSGAQSREVRGAPVRPVDDGKERRKEARKQREEKLEKWFGLPKHKMTPELEKELKALRLRANFDPKRFYKANDSQELPKYFTIATEVGGGMAATGLHTKTPEVKAHSGRSFLDSIIRDQKVQEWTGKKNLEVSSRHFASLSSGHGKRKHEGARSTKRGGAWKKKKRG